jgi:predicted phosphodiesterase
MTGVIVDEWGTARTDGMRWLILPDIHDKLRRANQIIEREPHDRLLLMGDFFDDFRTGVTDAADTANQVKL